MPRTSTLSSAAASVSTTSATRTTGATTSGLVMRYSLTRSGVSRSKVGRPSLAGNQPTQTMSGVDGVTANVALERRVYAGS